MDRTNKIRFAFFTAIVVFLGVTSISYAREIYNVLYIIPSKSGNIIIDGSDFTAFFNSLVLGLNFVVGFIVTVPYTIAVVIINVIVFLMLRLLSIRKNSIVSEIEIRRSKVIVISVTVVSYLTAVVLTRFSLIMWGLFLFWQIPLFAYVLYIIPLSQKK